MSDNNIPKLRFTWNIHYTCNYRCPYCFFDGKWVEYKKRNAYLGVEEWMKLWENIYQRHGRSYILVTGGEPFIYPNFIELIARLSQIHYPINISTNASGDLKTFIQKVECSKVSLSVSLQLNHESPDDFIEKVKLLRAHNVLGCINFVAYPPFISHLANIRKKFSDMGEELKVIPFWGNYQGKEYPFAYTSEDKERIGLGDDWLSRKRKKDSLCPAGYTSALIFPDGKVARCGQIGERDLVGNFFDEHFSLLQSPQACDAEFCPCDEGQLFGEEKKNDAHEIQREAQVTPSGEDVHYFKELQRKNRELNDKEYNEKRVILQSSPRSIFIQAAGPCNSYCTFCSRGPSYRFFDLKDHRKSFEKNLYPYIDKSETLILTGSGEYLRLPEAPEILDFFDARFPHVDKCFSTNGSSLVKWAADKIINGKANFTIHVSLHASNAKLHKVMTRMDNFDTIIEQVKYILSHRKDPARPRVHLIFVATTLNIEDLPDFVRLAARIKADKVICYYNFIYVQAQKYLSCFFKPELTNRMLDEARLLAEELKISLGLPFRFQEEHYPDLGPCREAFSQIMLDAEGKVLPCDASEDCHEQLTTEKSFMDIWNSQYYQNLRKLLLDDGHACSRHCLRANPAGVNEFNSHVIYRGGRQDEEINVLWGDNF